jgi:luciferase family oxidoreductase group 1
VPIWILGSSLYGAQLAAALGLPYAFASHFAPGALDEAIAIYRRDFRPSAQLKYPYVMAGFNVFAAATAEEARLVATSMQQAFVRLRTGQPGKLQPPLPGYYESLPPPAQAMLTDVLSASTIGTQADVERDLSAFIRRTQVDEVILSGQIYDFDARKRSLEIAMAAASAVSGSHEAAAAQ